MSRTPANITQADVARVIRAARQAGAPGVEIRMGGTVIWVPLTEERVAVAAPVEPEDEVVL